MKRANFYEKALFVKADVAAALWLNATALCPSRYASIRTLGEPTLSVTRCIDGIRLFELKALQSSDRPSRRVDQVRIAQSP